MNITDKIDYKLVSSELKAIAHLHKGCKLFYIGKSTLGRKLWAIKIGSHDAAETTLYAACFHPLEYITTGLMLQFAENISSAYENAEQLCDIEIKDVLMKKNVVIIPLMNPDGLEINLKGAKSAGKYEDMVNEICRGNTSIWNSNARGVDLNHNYNAGFNTLRGMEEKLGISGPSHSKFSGYSPESERETQALTSFCRTKNITKAFAFHSQGEEIYYKYGENTPKRSKIIADIIASSSGYKVLEPTGTASHGGFKDWFIDELKKPGFTIEIGKGTNPLPISELQPIYARLLESLILGIIL